ncbi:MAG: D-aminoacyl-tRNA deacylase [Acidobacteriota bacterium]
MRVVIQRVKEASVVVDGEVVGEIGEGLLVYLGVRQGDQQNDADYLLDKVLNLRIFEDQDRKMNRSVQEAQGSILVVSQFTLYGDCRKGRRPSFSEAAAPLEAESLYNYFVARCRETQVVTETGLFRAMMQVRAINWGPVTMLLDSQRTF